jgi:hypothetical protein
MCVTQPRYPYTELGRLSKSTASPKDIKMERVEKLMYSGIAICVLGVVGALAVAAPTKNKDNEKRNEKIQIALYLTSIAIALYFIWR